MNSSEEPAGELQYLLRDLIQAFHDHEVWAELFHGSLVFGVPVDGRDIGENAHHECRFGKWYDEASRSNLHVYPGFNEIGRMHQRMHAAAARMLQSVMNGSQISANDNDTFLA